MNGNLELKGNAFAVSSTLAVTTYHNLDNITGKILVGNEFNRELGFPKSAVRVVVKSRCDSSEDWALLSILEGDPFPVHASIAPEEDLPFIGDKIYIKDYPIDLAGITETKLTLHLTHSKVTQYNTRPVEGKRTTKKGPHLIADAELKVDSKRDEDEVVVETGRVGGSCGAPYFNDRGQVFAFHVASISESDPGSSVSQGIHVSYSIGRVFCRLPNFMSCWRDTTRSPSL